MEPSSPLEPDRATDFPGANNCPLWTMAGVAEIAGLRTAAEYAKRRRPALNAWVEWRVVTTRVVRCTASQLLTYQLDIEH
jgi:hypothetical protein